MVHTPTSRPPTERSTLAAEPSFSTESWRKSTYCVGESHCVEVADNGSVIGLRNSRQPEITLTFDVAEWRIFIEDLRSGDLLLDRRPGA
ncbi:DUF397 domain-containing protein [Actinoplanes sp. NPDC051411]|uniref:DUF397 domain-containing protein n=1 Tax=Actinoplanes sp. NPDC051411 TaxID=3155522 RepID=UPI00341E3944